MLELKFVWPWQCTSVRDWCYTRWRAYVPTLAAIEGERVCGIQYERWIEDPTQIEKLGYVGVERKSK